MNATTSHPAHDQLVRFGRGLLPDEEHQVVEAHVATCDECTAQLTALDADSLAQLLRQSPQLVACSDSTPLPCSLEGPTASFPGLFPAEGTPVGDDPGTIPQPLRDHARYRVIRLIGRGGMGNVYLAEHRHMGRVVALKVIDPSILDNPAAVRRFRQEVKAAAQLSHANIVQAHDSDEAGGLHFLVLEYVEGQQLAAYAAKAGPLPYQEACEYARQAALALQYAHDAGLVHRDIKPHNLMVTPDGRVKVLDFGLARVLARPGVTGASATQAGALMGTPDYMPPEQARDAGTVDGRADVYSLGCTLYHLLTGQPPFPGGTPVEKVARHLTEDVPALDAARPGLPAGLAEVVARMTARDPDQRYQTAGEAAAALAPFASPEARPREAVRTAGALSPTAVEREAAPRPDATVVTLPRGPRRRSRVPWGRVAALAMVFGMVAVAGVVIYRIQTDKGELVIQAEKDVEVVISKDGNVVRIIDTKTKKSVTLDSGTYDLELKGKSEGLKLNIKEATLKRGKTVIAKIVWEEKDTGKQPANAKDKEKQPVTADPPIIHPLHRIRWPEGVLYSVDLSPDNRYVVAGKYFPPPPGRPHSHRPKWEVARMWHLETGKYFQELPETETARFTPDGKHVLSVGRNANFTLREVATGNVVRQFGSGQPYSGMGISASGHRGVTWLKGQPWKFLVFDWSTGKELCQHESEGLLTPDGRHLLRWVGTPSKLLAYDASTGKEVNAYQQLRNVPPFSMSRNGKVLLCRDERNLKVYEVATGKEVGSIDGIGDGSVILSGDGRRLLTTTDHRYEFHVWDVTARRVIARLRFPEPLNDLKGVQWQFSVDGQWAAFVGPTDSVYVFRIPLEGKGKDR